MNERPENTQRIRFRCEDKNAARMFPSVAKIIKDVNGGDSVEVSLVPALDITSASLKTIKRYCERYVQEKHRSKREAIDPRWSSAAWKSVSEDPKVPLELGKIVLISDYLKVDHLVEEALKAIASSLRDQPVEEIRTLFQLADDISNGQKKIISEEHSCLNGSFDARRSDKYSAKRFIDNISFQNTGNILNVAVMQLLGVICAPNILDARQQLILALRAIVNMSTGDSMDNEINTTFNPDFISNHEYISSISEYCIPEVRNFPKDLQMRLWRHCTDRDIFRLLHTCQVFSNSIAESSWWRGRLEQEIGPINYSLDADWRSLYLAYSESWKPCNGNKVWKPQNIDDDSFRESYGYEAKDYLYCLTDRQIMLLGSTRTRKASNFLINQIFIFVDSSSERDILVDGKSYCCIWNEPKTVWFEFYCPIDFLYGEVLERSPEKVVFRNEVEVWIDADSFSDTIKVRGTGEVIAEKIDKVTHKFTREYYFEGLLKTGPHYYELLLGT